MAADTTTAVTSYSNQTSTFLAGLVSLAYDQYQNDQPAVPVPKGWKQVAAFTVPEIDLNQAAQDFLDANPDLVQRMGSLTSAASDPQLDQDVMSAVQSFAGQNALAAGARQVLIGFAMMPDSTASQPGDSNAVVFRGTLTPFEWGIDGTAFQIPVGGWYSDGRFSLARAHLGFMIMFGLLNAQVSAAVEQFDLAGNPDRPTYFTGHSLGAAVATLTALMTRLRNLLAPIQLYNQASPRVGNPTFVTAYNWFLANSFRVVNLADIVPIVPPTELNLTVHGIKFDFTYAHVGQEWSFLNQTGNVVGNHSLKLDYLPTITASVVSDRQPTYPTTCICG